MWVMTSESDPPYRQSPGLAGLAQSCLEDALELAQSWYDAEAETSACGHLSELHLSSSHTNCCNCPIVLRASNENRLPNRPFDLFDVSRVYR